MTLVANNNVNVAPGDTVLCCDKSSNSNVRVLQPHPFSVLIQ